MDARIQLAEDITVGNCEAQVCSRVGTDYIYVCTETLLYQVHGMEES